MRTKFVTTIALAGLLSGSVVTGTALAAGHAEDREATALQNAKVTLSEAIATAEKQTGGKAFDAGADAKNSQPRITVETNGPKGVQTVIVDAQSGKIVGSHAGGETD
jgi:uncharacterized membrane protein YkoI